MILPLPPHLPELFLPVADVTFLQPDEITLHGGLHEYGEKAVKGTRACRAKAQEMQALVFEAFRENKNFFVDGSIAEVIDPKMLPAGVRLIPHLRPHRNPKDVLIQPTAQSHLYEIAITPLPRRWHAGVSLCFCAAAFAQRLTQAPPLFPTPGR